MADFWSALKQCQDEPDGRKKERKKKTKNSAAGKNETFEEPTGLQQRRETPGH
jgi:hypothetical protein